MVKTVVCMAKVTDVAVDGEPHVRFAKQIAAEDSVNIEFRCDTDVSVWHQDHTVH